MTSDPIKNSVDEQFINDIKENCMSPLIWETTAHIIQKYIKDLVQHEVDVITDSDWFAEKVYECVDTVRDSKNV
jgi:protein-arginine kinase